MSEDEGALTYTRCGWPLSDGSGYDPDAHEVEIAVEDNEASVFCTLAHKNDKRGSSACAGAQVEKHGGRRVAAA